LTHYRVAFFESLRTQLASANVDLMLAYGDATAEEERKADGGDIDWAHRLRTRYFLNGRICAQRFEHLSAGCDLTVVTHENKLLFNLKEQYFGQGRKLALWGHGGNLQGNPSSLRERFKRRVARQADWWFGYTDMSLPLIERSGFPRSRVTILNNSVDTAAMRAQLRSITPSDQRALIADVGLCGGPVGVFVGSLYEEKRIPFLLDAAVLIRERVPDFELLIVGGGKQADLVESFCRNRTWAHYLGVRKGREKVLALSLGHVLLNPGLVGLGILDSFVCRIPMITTDCGLHSPEIAYLAHGVNGVMTPDSMPDFVDATCVLLRDEAGRRKMQEGCARSSEEYTVDNMAKNFSAGVQSCLSAPPLRWKR
jgi:glycosyltransferase involved in cell wall biosynthesis